MKTIGQYLRQARKDKRMTLQELSAETKIRREFLASLEKERWGKLPEFPVVSGFVKGVAGAVDMNKQQAMALLRRDYPPNPVLEVVPKPDIPREFRLSPQLTFFFGVGTIILAIGIYLASQYIAFVRPPTLVVDEPQEGVVVIGTELAVLGSTNPDTTVIVNTQPALVESDGSFKTVIEITTNTTMVEVVATSRAGKETRVVRTIKPELEEN